jgi:hypothetical protein
VVAALLVLLFFLLNLLHIDAQDVLVNYKGWKQEDGRAKGVGWRAGQ